MVHYSWRGDTLLLYCHIQPNAAQHGFAGLFNDRLKVRVAATAANGAANDALLRYLAAQFNVPKSRVALVKGASSRQKTITVVNPQMIPEAVNITRP